MARRCKCFITGEVGTTNTFVKIGNHYYKNKEVYEADQKEKEKYKNLIDYICREFLGYGNGQPFPPVLPKKINELSYYDYEVILEAFKECSHEIHYWLEHKQFSSEYGKLSYMFAIVKDKIADVNKTFVRKQKQDNQLPTAQIECGDISDLGTKNKGKDISSFLDDDEF